MLSLFLVASTRESHSSASTIQGTVATEFCFSGDSLSRLVPVDSSAARSGRSEMRKITPLEIRNSIRCSPFAKLLMPPPDAEAEPIASTSERETSAALLEVKAHLLSKAAPTFAFLTRPRVRKLSKFDREQLRLRAKEDETVSDDFFGEQHKSLGTVRLRISRAQEGVEGRIRWLGSVVGSAGRNSGESSRSMRRNKSVHQVVEGEQVGVEDFGMSMGTKVYSHLSLLGVQNSRTSSSSSLSSEISTSIPTPDVSIPGTPAPSLAISPTLPTNKAFPFSPRANLSPPTRPLSGSSTTSLNASPHIEPPSRTLTLENTAVSRRDSKLSFSPSHHKKLSIRPREFQRMLAKRRKKADGKLGLLAGDADDDEILAKALMEIGVAVEEKEKFVLEILYEHQRG